MIDTLIVGVIVAAMALPTGAPAGGSDDRQAQSSPSLQIGLGVVVDSDWISLKGTWSVLPAPRDDDANGVTYELTIGSVPNIPSRVRKGVALVRAIRTTTVCVARHLLQDQLDSNRPQGK
jgi:hypothetical protein